MPSHGYKQESVSLGFPSSESKDDRRKIGRSRLK